MVGTIEREPARAGDVDLAALESIQRRVLWLSSAMIHHANHVRPNVDGLKIGGHQASSASVVSILTALYFGHLRAGDRVAIKPHASPAFHAVQYLLGRLPREYLTTLRQFHGLQAYPSRTKDPDPVDFSLGSVGFGATATAFAALTQRYVASHFGLDRPGRFVAVLGDAELDEGNVWEAVAEEHVSGLGNVLWVVDLNRQSLDRVIPGIRASQLEEMFRANRWHVIEAKYGRKLRETFARPGGETLRRCIDEMSNEQYQGLIRQDGAEIRARLARGADGARLLELLEEYPDRELPGLLGDLGGHDVSVLLEKFAEAEAHTASPTVLFAYTVKGWGLPFAGDPLNHAAQLSDAQMEELRAQLGVGDDPWARFPDDAPEAHVCRHADERMGPRSAAGARLAAAIPAATGTRVPPTVSSQEAFGRILTDLAGVAGVGERIVTASPDVAVSTNLGGWVNKVGVFHATPQEEVPLGGPRLLRWQPGPTGQHVELGISEMNLFTLLGQLGVARELFGQPLLPIGTVYDPFICRGLDAFVHALYSGGRFVIVATPSGITLSPEGGAHQSTVTPGLGIELPNLIPYEPCFAREVEWTLLEALRQCADPSGESTYLRLSTRQVDQALLEPALRRLGEAQLRADVLAGGYRLVDWRDPLSRPSAGTRASGPAPTAVRPAAERPEPTPPGPVGDVDRSSLVQIAAAGAVVPEAVEAARRLAGEGIAANVLNLTSAGTLYRELAERRRGGVRAGRGGRDAGHLARLIPPDERSAPIVTVIDGASHALAFLGSAFGAPTIPLGVDTFGQSGTVPDLYHEYGLNAEHIVNAALLALELRQDV